MSYFGREQITRTLGRNLVVMHFLQIFMLEFSDTCLFQQFVLTELNSYNRDCGF